MADESDEDVPTIQVGDIRVPIVDIEGAVIACQFKGDPATFSDNEYGTCASCGADIQFRPYNKGRGRLSCIPCALLIATVDALSGNKPVMAVSSQGADEVREYRKRSGN